MASNDIMSGMQTIAGAGMTAFGMPQAGIPMMMSGASGFLGGGGGAPVGTPGYAGPTNPMATAMGGMGAGALNWPPPPSDPNISAMAPFMSPEGTYPTQPYQGPAQNIFQNGFQVGGMPYG